MKLVKSEICGGFDPIYDGVRESRDKILKSLEIDITEKIKWGAYWNSVVGPVQETLEDEKY